MPVTRKQLPVCHIADGLRRHLVPIDQVSADPANLRKHPEVSIEAIRQSYARFGQQKPIVIDAHGVTIAGAGQLEAARRLGWTHIAAVRSDLAGVDRVAYAIADNRSAELSQWDEEGLAKTLGAMLPGDIEATGFTGDDLAKLAGPSEAAAPDPGVPELPKRAISRSGDLWILGNHRLLAGDSTSHAEVMRVMDGQRARLIVTDPPYLVGYDGTNHPQSFTGGGSKDWSGSYGSGWDENDGESDLYERFIAAAAAQAADEDAAWYVWHASRRQVLLEQAMQKAGLLVHCQIVWAKNKPVLTRTWYMWQHEPCLMGWKTGMKPDKGPEAEPMSTVWTIDTIPNGDERPDHPTPKPLEVYTIPIRQHTRAGDIVFDSFSGSGTCIVACEQTGRRARTIEQQPLYVDVAVTRWQRMTGQAARLDGDGRTFDEIAQERARCRNAPRAPAATRDAESSPKAGTAQPTSKSTSPKRGARSKDRPTRAGTARAGVD